MADDPDAAARRSHLRPLPAPEPEVPPPPGDLLRGLARSGVAGAHGRWGDRDVEAMLRELVRGDRRLLLGMEPLRGITVADAVRRAAAVWGWEPGEVRASTDPRRTYAAGWRLASTFTRIAEAGGSIAFATGRPASLLGLHTSLVARARQLGAQVPIDTDTGDFLSDGRRGRRLRWVAGVAVVTDGVSLLPTQGIEAGEELLARIPRPDLLVGDHGFAVAAWRAGVPIAAFVDFDALVLAVAVGDGPSAVLVPLDDQRAPVAYEALTTLVSASVEH